MCALFVHACIGPSIHTFLPLEWTVGMHDSVKFLQKKKHSVLYRKNYFNLMCSQLYLDYQGILNNSAVLLMTDQVKLATAVVTVLLFGSAQRPEAVANITMKEYGERQAVDDVTETTRRHPPVRPVSPWTTGLLVMVDEYVHQIRHQVGDGTTVLLLPSASGAKKVTKVSRLIKQQLKSWYNLTIPTANKLRKAVATIGAKTLYD